MILSEQACAYVSACVCICYVRRAKVLFDMPNVLVRASVG